MLVQNLLGLFQRGPDWYGDQIVLGHYLADGYVETRFEAQITIGKYADELAVLLRDGHA